MERQPVASAPPLDSPPRRQLPTFAPAYDVYQIAQPPPRRDFASPVPPMNPMPPMPPMNPIPPMPPMPQVPGQPRDYYQSTLQPKYVFSHHQSFRVAHSDAGSEDDDDSSFHAFAKETGRLAVFHALNGVLGYLAFTICVGGVAASVGLLPLCCCGLVVFRLLLYAVYGFAQLDVMLYNYITPQEDHVYVQVPQNPRAGQLSGERLAPSLASFSPLSLMALIYFCSVKFLLSTLSTVCFSLAVTAPLSLLCAILGIGHGKFFSVQFGPEDIADFDSDPLIFLLATACLFAIGVALMHLVAKASREATRFFCCERFSTYRYVHHQHYDPAGAHFYPTASHAYGSVPTADPSLRVDPPAPVLIRFNSGGV